MTGSNITPLPKWDKIQREAALWAIRLDNPDVSEDVYDAFRKWRDQSTQHYDAAEQFIDFWEGMEELDTFNDLAETSPVLKARQLDFLSKYWFNSRAVLRAAASAAAIICAVVVYQVSFFSEPPFKAGYSTIRGAQQTVNLPDGSTVVLNTDSAFDVEFSDTSRTIILTRGEAYFKVAKNPEKPFSVKTDRGTVTAVGTEFSVRVHQDNIAVLVTEGRVALRPLPAPLTSEQSVAQLGDIADTEVVEVSRGQTVTLGQQVKELDIVEPKDMQKQLDWQDGLLSFHGEPLRKVVAEISRYTDMVIEIEDEQLAERRVVAYYEIGKVEPMFEALKLTANVQVDRINDQHVRLTRAY